MRITENDNFVEIEVVDRVPAHLPTPGDVEVSVEVSSGKFRGQAFAWLDAKTLANFVTQLRALERTRTGFAEVNGMSPGEFRLRIFMIDRQGHVAIEGRIVNAPSRGFRQSLEYGFEIDPTSLPKVLSDFASIANGTA